MPFNLNSSLGIAALFVAAMVIVYFSRPKAKTEETDDENIHEKQVAVSRVSSAKEEESNKQNDLEIIAAVMGALSAYLDTPISNLRIKSIKRVDGTNSAWRREGIVKVLEDVK